MMDLFELRQVYPHASRGRLLSMLSLPPCGVCVGTGEHLDDAGEVAVVCAACAGTGEEVDG